MRVETMIFSAYTALLSTSVVHTSELKLASSPVHIIQPEVPTVSATQEEQDDFYDYLAGTFTHLGFLDVLKDASINFDYVNTDPSNLSVDAQEYLRDRGVAIQWKNNTGVLVKEYYSLVFPEFHDEEFHDEEKPDHNGCTPRESDSERIRQMEEKGEEKERKAIDRNMHKIPNGDLLSKDISTAIEENDGKDNELLSKAISTAMEEEGYRHIETKIVGNGGNIVYSQKLKILFVGTHKNSESTEAAKQIYEKLSAEAKAAGIKVVSVEKKDPCHNVGYHLDTFFLELDGHLFIERSKLTDETFNQLKKIFGQNITILTKEEAEKKATQAVLIEQGGKFKLVPSGPVPDSITSVCNEKGIEVIKISKENEDLISSINPSSGLRCLTVHPNPAIPNTVVVQKLSL